MKKILVIALAVVAFTSCKQSTSDQAENNTSAIASSSNAPAVLAEDAPKFKFEKTIYEFGVIQDGEKIQTTFKFKNIGKTPLIIADATATCGCTVPEYPKTPIKPGEGGSITVVFDSHGKIGLQDKAITIISNANPEAEKLHLVGEVKGKE